MEQVSPPNEAEMLNRLTRGEVLTPPLNIAWTAGGARASRAPDAVARVTWGSADGDEGGRGTREERNAVQFAAEIKARSAPRAFAEAVDQAQRRAGETGARPMIVLPYLSPGQLEQLERLGVSGIDLCGNAFVMAPGRLFVLRTGAPNLFRESQPIRAVYRGATSLVARALLLRPVSASLSDLEQFIRSRDGSITLSTISKALRRMEDDVLIERSGGRAQLLQPDSLLEKLTAAYQPPRLGRTLAGSCDLRPGALGARLAASTSRAVLTGRSSTLRYAVMGREDTITVYCESIPDVVEALGADFKPVDRFANLELLESVDPGIYFDCRPVDGVPYASPIQTYLELASGDKREQEVAAQVRSLILDELGSDKNHDSA